MVFLKFFRLFSKVSLFFLFYVATFFICTDQTFPFFQHISPAFRAFFLGRLLPAHKIAFRMVLTSIISASFLCLPQNHLASAFRTFYSDFFQIRLCVPAVRKTGARKKLAVGAIFYHHIAAALIADHICNLIFNLDFLKLFLRFLYGLIQIRPEIPHNCFPRNLSVSTQSRSPSILAVKLTSTILGNACFIILFTTSPSSVMYRFLFSLATYLRFMIVLIVGAYVLGRPMPSSSRVLTRDASV